MVKKILGYLLKGAAFLVPLFLILFLVTTAVQFFVLLAPAMHPAVLLFGTVTIVALVGFVLAEGVGSYITRHAEALFSRFPVAGYLYTIFKKLSGTGDIFEHPVWVERENKTERRLGFITKHDMDDFHLPDHVAVYLPEPFTFFGETVILHKQQLTPVDAPKASVVSLALSAGLVDPREVTHKPHRENARDTQQTH